ncbi:carbohydrate ABC transporter permease [Humidisolicoccus flavus]|uniref:carbohydrate ABC transporter permease n=1 Tax=Humidisolicoccus flavus TaxID=3111414 RepID=UPI003249A1FA
MALTEAIVLDGAKPTRRRRFGAQMPGWTSLLSRTILVVAVAMCLFPILYLVLMSFKNASDILSVRIFPSTLAWQNWVNAFADYPIMTYLGNSVVVALGSTLLALAISIPANYAIARLRTGGNNILGLIVSIYIAPPIVAIVPLFLLVRGVRLMDTIAGLLVVEALLLTPVVIWLLDNFFRAIPEEIDEAAQLDGCGPWRTLTRVILPLVMPGVVAVGIIAFILSYNDFLIPLMLGQSGSTQTLPVGIALMQGGREVAFGRMAAAAFIGMVPVYILALFMQRWLIGGLTQGSVK